MDEKIIEHVRTICLGIPGASEGAHSGSLAFRIGTTMFATLRTKPRPRLGIALEPAHASHLLDHDPRFEPYQRARDVVLMDLSDVTDWGEVKALVEESFDIALRLKKPATKKRPAVKKEAKATKKPTRPPRARRG